MRRSCLSPTHCLSHHCATPGFRLASGPHGNRTRIAAESDPRGDGFQRDPLSLTPPPPLTPTLSPLRGGTERPAAHTPTRPPRPGRGGEGQGEGSLASPRIALGHPADRIP